MTTAIANEYAVLLRRKADIEKTITELPRGYISRKRINGREHKYLQMRVNGKVRSTYLKASEAERTAENIALRKELESRLPAIEKRLEEIEHAVELLDIKHSRKLEVLKLSIGMDELSAGMRERCVSFSDAMTSLECVSASSDAREALNSWVQGNVSFLSVLENTLRKYGFSAEVNN